MSLKRIFYIIFGDIVSDLLFAGVLLYPTVRYWERDAFHIIGVAIAVAGIALWVTARFNLGSSFSVLPEATTLRTKGLYRYFLNPIYYFSLLTFFGILVSYDRDGLFMALILPLLFLQLVRMRKERIVLEQRFGDEYREYRKRAWF